MRRISSKYVRATVGLRRGKEAIISKRDNLPGLLECLGGRRQIISSQDKEQEFFHFIFSSYRDITSTSSHDSFGSHDKTFAAESPPNRESCQTNQKCGIIIY